MGVAISKTFLLQFPFSDDALNNPKTGFCLIRSLGSRLLTLELRKMVHGKKKWFMVEKTVR